MSSRFPIKSGTHYLVIVLGATPSMFPTGVHAGIMNLVNNHIPAMINPQHDQHNSPSYANHSLNISHNNGIDHHSLSALSANPQHPADQPGAPHGCHWVPLVSNRKMNLFLQMFNKINLFQHDFPFSLVFKVSPDSSGPDHSQLGPRHPHSHGHKGCAQPTSGSHLRGVSLFKGW